ncbi:MAG: SUMF1/EgtB/PvdO family nonheme iron enzyme, partial [Deltaproteobacteria bacterium]|nr:SUMF1/EgtB/PvdO family nonheme iron enzyme [Deltaproteobacteria bacterium]
MSHRSFLTRVVQPLSLILALGGCGPTEVPVRAPTVDPLPAAEAPEGFAVIPSGSFVMGSPSSQLAREEHEGPTWEVALTSSFLLGRTEVTVGAFEGFVAATGHVTDAETAGWGQGANGHERTPGLSWRAPGFQQAEDHPVVGVSWNDATAYADWRSSVDGLPPCYAAGFTPGCLGWRLPTEAEWEWAARAGTTGPWGPLTESGRGCEATALTTIAWMCSNARGSTHPVGSLAANPWGVHDLLGNAWEWVHDGFDDYPGDAEDPLGGAPGDDRANSGCGWGSRVEDCRVAMRVEDPPDVGFDNLGFRLARTVPMSRTDHRQALLAARR